MDKIGFNYEHELKIGSIVEVRGKKLVCRVFSEKNGPYLFLNGKIIKNVSVSSYVLIPKGYSLILGKIEGEIVKDRLFEKEYYKEIDLFDRKIEISILGIKSNGIFTSGITEIPLINTDVYIASDEFLEEVFDFSKKDTKTIAADFDNDEKISVGIEISENFEVYAGVDDLFASHIGIFGNTGSGKSYTLNKLYSALFSKFPINSKNRNSKFIFLDFNGEYQDCFEGKSYCNLSDNKYDVSDKLYLPNDAIFTSDLWIALSNAAEKTHQPFIRDAVKYFHKIHEQSTKIIDNLHSLFMEIKEYRVSTKDSQIISIDFSFIADMLDSLFSYNLEEMESYCKQKDGFYISKEEFMDRFDLKIHSTKNDNNFYVFKFAISYIYLKEYFKGKIDPYFQNLINRVNEKIEVLSRIITNNLKEYNPILVIDMRKLSLEYKKILPMIIARRYFKMQNSKQKPINSNVNIIIDEAHNILSDISDRENEDWKKYRLETFEEIIKEGRKFGVFLTLASQRPSDISTTIISQLHNYFIHRLVNNQDISMIGKSVSFLDSASFEMIPFLPIGTCVYSGVSTKFPLIIKIINSENYQVPNSATISIIKNLSKK